MFRKNFIIHAAGLVLLIWAAAFPGWEAGPDLQATAGMFPQFQSYAYHAVRIDGGFRADSPDQHYSANFTTEGVSFFFNGSALRLRTTAIGYGNELCPLPKVAPAAVDNRIEYFRGMVAEWYLNGPSGVQQGFTLERRPMLQQDPGELLTIALEIDGGWRAEIAEDGRSLTFFGGSTVLVCNGLTAIDAMGTKHPVSYQHAGTPGAIHIVVDDRNAVYPLIIDPFFQQAYLKAETPAIDALFGEVVAIDGDRAVISARNENDGTGAVYVFMRQGAAWVLEARLQADDPQQSSSFGNSVDISGNYIVVGAPGADINYGAAYIFQYSNYSWNQIAKLSPEHPQDGENYGWTVAVSGTTVLVGSYYRTFEKQNQGKILYAGAVDVWVLNGTTWTFQTTLTAEEPQDYQGFGYALAIDGDIALIGAYTHDVGSVEDAGCAFIYRRNGSTWNYEATLTADAPINYANFGWSVGISNGNAVVGEPFRDKGAAYVFSYSNGSWSLNDSLLASNGDNYDYFGWSLAVSGNVVVVGAWNESSDGSGPQNNNLGSSGAAYVFVPNGNSWAETSFIKAANCGAGDSFGYYVAVDGNYLLVGAYGEDSNGISPADNSFKNAGAAYIFKVGPSVQCSAAQIAPTEPGSVSISWTRGNGDGCAVFVKEGSSGSAEPVDNIVYTASPTFGLGDQIGSSGWFCVYAGTDTSVEINGLESGKAYRIHVCEYINGSIYYNTSLSADNPVTYEFPIAVKLAVFQALREEGRIRITWKTENEADLAGFVLYAADAETGPFERISCDLIPASGGQARGSLYVFYDEPPRAGRRWYRLELIRLDGGRELSQTIAVSSSVESSAQLDFALHPNYPNPFNAQTVIRFDLPEAAVMNLAVYDARGRVVTTLRNGNVPAGSHEVIWDGRDDGGNSLASGVYYCRLTAAGQSFLQKMILVK